MKEYHKIEALYERDMEGTKKLLVGQFRNPAVKMLKDVQWIGKEKIDGTNIRIYWDGHRVQIAGRTDKSDLHKDLVAYLQSVFGTPEAEEIFEQRFGDKEVYLFGEGYGEGIQGVGKLYRPDKAFIMFDVCVNGMFLPLSAITEIATAFGVPAVQALCVGTLDELVAFVKSKPVSPSSQQPQVIEGLVASPEVEMRDQSGNRMVVKIKVRDFE